MVKSISIDFRYLFLSALFGIIFRYASGATWMISLKLIGLKKLDFIEFAYIYSKSWLGRYIPGKVTWILGKIVFASSKNLSKKRLTVASIAESLILILASFIIGLIFITFTKGYENIDKTVLIISIFFVLSLLAFLLPTNFNFLIHRVAKVKDIDVDDIKIINSQYLLTILLCSAVYTFFNGVSEFFIVQSIYNTHTINDFFYINGVTNLAGAVGIIAFFAPGGIGIKETSQVTLLSLIMPLEFAVVASIMSRIIQLLLDLLFFGINFTIFRFSSSSSK